jgi:STE24 endopeptidase
MSRRSSATPPWRSRADGTWPWPAALAGLAVTAGAALALLRPRSGLMAPDPVRREELFDAAEVARARAYRRAQLRLGVASGAARAAVLLALARRPAAGGRGRGARSRRARARPRTAARVGAVDAVRGAGLVAGLTAVALPFDVAAQRRARDVGLATQTWAAWGVDAVKSAGIGVTLGGAASAALLALIRRAPRSWWLAAAGAGVAGGTTLTLLAPVLLDPVFNRFAPLADGPLRDDVFDLARRAGVRVREVYEVDASRRTTAVNAYVTGLGPTKRVVLFDTLLQRFTPEEARVVVAHELGHVRHRDVHRGLVYMALVAPAALQAAAALARQLRPAGQDADVATLAALALAAGVVGALLGPAAGPLSRTVEVRADVFSLRLTDAPEAFISFERKIVAQNLADPDPPRWLVALGASHPPALRRIGVARAYERLAGVANGGPAGAQSADSEPG